MIIPAGQANAGTYWYHFDALGSVVALSQYNSTNGCAAICERYRYAAFGETEILDSGFGPRASSLYNNPYMFTGRRYDPETATAARSALYHYHARAYAPNLGRFLQTDPIGYNDSMNLYQYCGNNAVKSIDPYGLKIVPPTNNRAAYDAAIAYLMKSKRFRETYEILDKDPRDVTIQTKQ